MGNNKKLIGIDLLRVIAIIGIFLFHSSYHISFGLLNGFIKNGAVFMDLFFIITGFVIFLTNYNKDNLDIKNIKDFLFRRFCSIYPAYIFVGVIFLTFYSNNVTSFQKLLIIPMDLLLLQSAVPGSFGTGHHGGTWFISCLVFCYFISPYLVEVVKRINQNTAIIFGIVLYFICSYLPWVQYYMKYSWLYPSIILRISHFFIGILVCKYYIECSYNLRNKDIKVFLLLGILVYGTRKLSFYGLTFSTLDFFVIPIFVLLTVVMAIYKANNRISKFISDFKILKYLNYVAYEFFLAQFFCFRIVNDYCGGFFVATRLRKLILFFIVCFVISILLKKLISEPCKNYLLKRSLRSD